jgi:hypothetical protein
MSGQARMDGWRRIGLDDAFPIRQALPVGVRFWRWARFSIEKIVHYNRYNKFTLNTIAPGRWAWVNGFGLS